MIAPAIPKKNGAGATPRRCLQRGRGDTEDAELLETADLVSCGMATADVTGDLHHLTGRDQGRHGRHWFQDGSSNNQKNQSRVNS